MAVVIPMMVVPSQNPLFIGSGGSKRELKNQSDKNIAFRLIFPPGSNFSATSQFGMIPAYGKSFVEFRRNNGKYPEERMTVEYAAMEDNQTDPRASFATGKPVGEFIGETEVRLSPMT
ncbi:hypothetical protein V3C99_007807 [Haemonchus contortus]|nr:Unknown [Haemonchus contortus]